MWRYALLPLVAVAAGLARWLVQGQRNLYTMMHTRYYAPDPDLGWRFVTDGPPRLGLEAIGAIASYTVGLLVTARIVDRWGRLARWRRTLRGVLWVASALPLAVPAWAFARGWLPAGAQITAPKGVGEVQDGVAEGGLPGLPAGTWTVVPHAGTSVTATIDAGGEDFEARFPKVTGWWRGAPGDLRQPMTAELSVAAADIDTGIELRSKHAHEEYLQGAKFPRITFALKRVVGATVAGGAVTFRAEGELGFIGRTHPVVVTGTLRAPDAAGRTRLGSQLGFGADAAVLLVEAAFDVRIADTALAPDRGDFGKDTIAVRVNLVMLPGHPSSPGGTE
jgi:polyisoprenoid-binding protein YceI